MRVACHNELPMMPLNDVEANRYASFPIMTLGLIVANIIVFSYERMIFTAPTEQYYSWLQLYGTVPALIVSREGGGALTAVTHLFLHGDIWHLSGNMLALWVFGRRVEDVCGPLRFLLFYLVCGVFADIVSTMVHLNSTIPGIGASGAIYGVMSAYLILFPRGRIRTFVLLLYLPIFPKIRAYWIILYFLVLQIGPATLTLLGGAQYRVAHWAHLGGFIGGVFVFLFLRAEAYHRVRNALPL